MPIISLFNAKTHLSSIITRLVEGKDEEVVISRHGKPLVRMTPIRILDVSRRIGLARGRFTVPDNIDNSNAAIAASFTPDKRGVDETAP